MKRIIVYGTQKDAEAIQTNGRCDIVGVCIDSSEYELADEYEKSSPYRRILIQELWRYDYDYIYITEIEEYSIIKNKLVSIGIDADKICFYEETKYIGELDYWKKKYVDEGNHFNNSWYKKLMLAIANEDDDEFMKDKVVADFGCGARGSLMWTKTPRERIGIDVLADQYLSEFGDCITKQKMLYVKSSEEYIPIPDNHVDILYTINSLDHVMNLKCMTRELLRIMKPSSILIASFNLHESFNTNEPQTLTEEKLYDALLKHFDVDSYRLAHKGKQDFYEMFYEGTLLDKLEIHEEGILWFRGRLKNDICEI